MVVQAREDGAEGVVVQILRRRPKADAPAALHGGAPAPDPAAARLHGWSVELSLSFLSPSPSPSQPVLVPDRCRDQERSSGRGIPGSGRRLAGKHPLVCRFFFFRGTRVSCLAPPPLQRTGETSSDGPRARTQAA